MQYNMQKWLRELPAIHKPMPLLSFPASQLIGASVYQITHDAAVQTEGILRVAKETDAAAAVRQDIEDGSMSVIMMEIRS